MSIDERGRAAAAEIRRTAADGVDPSNMLKALHRRRRIRTVGSVVTAVAACAALVVALVVAHDRSGKQRSEPAVPQMTQHTTTPAPPGKHCGASVICLGGRRFVIDLRVPVTITLPADFNRDVSVAGPNLFEAYRKDLNATGVSVMEDAIPVKYDGSWSRDPAAGRTTDSVAHWLSTRPFLTHTTVEPVTVGHLTGWQVTGDLKRGAPLPASKTIGSVAPTFAVDGGTAGYRPGLRGDYTVIDVPGAGVTVIWSWSANGTSPIRDNQAFIQGLSFG